jgi:hypothetical protein
LPIHGTGSKVVMKKKELERDFIEFELKAEYKQGIFAVYLEHKKYYWEII